MTFKKYFYTLFSVLLISAPLFAQRVGEDQLMKRAKLYVSQQKDKIGKKDRVIDLKLAKMYATDRVIKVVYTKENTAFQTLFPLQTEGRFKTEAQENRFVVREYMIWKAATDALASASFASVVRNDLYTWLVDVVGPDGTELYNFDFKTLSVRNAIDLCGGKMPTDFRDYLGKTLIERALHSLLKDVYLPHDSAGFCNVDLQYQRLTVDLLTTHNGYSVMKEHSGEAARNAWLGSFMKTSKSKRYFKDLCDIIKVRQISVEIKLRDVSDLQDSAMFKIYPTDILEFASKPAIADVESYIIGKLGGKKQTAEGRGKFIAQYGPNKTILTAAVAPSKSKRIYEVAEEMPSYPGGKQGIADYMARAVKYPGPCVDQRIEGRVVCRFTITKEGNLKDIVVTQSVDPLLDREAVRVLSLMPKWIPAKHNGERVDSKYSLPVTFRLTSQTAAN